MLLEALDAEELAALAYLLALSRRASILSLSLMKLKRIPILLDRIGHLRHPCELDLLLFFYRHPRAFLISERLAAYVGYDLAQVDQALEILITAGLLRRSPDSTDPARLYVLAQESRLGGWLSSLLQIAATREGRLAVIQALKQRQSLARSATSPNPSRALDVTRGG
jgi:DNA-binding MarR family transcriptional regulator